MDARMRVRYWLKLAIGNVSIAIAILLSLNLVAALLYDGREVLEKTFVPVSEKASQASLEDQEQARTIFREFSQLTTRYVPYVAWSREPFRGELTTVNDEGDRVHTSTTSSPRGHVRFFGGSTVWGKGVPDNDTIPAYFDRLYPEHSAYNHGESGFVSRQSVARLVNLINQDTPTDLVVFYDGCNDLYTLCRSDISINGHSRETKIARRVTPSSMVADAMTGALSEVILWAWGRSGHAKGPDSRCRTAEYAEQVARTLVNNWKAAHALAESVGAEFHGVLQPLAATGRANLSYMPGMLDSSDNRLHDYRTVYPLVQDLIREEQVDWMHDFSDVFDSDEKIYIDGCHVNDRGNAIVANRMNTTFGAAWAAGFESSIESSLR